MLLHTFTKWESFNKFFFSFFFFWFKQKMLYGFPHHLQFVFILFGVGLLHQWERRRGVKVEWTYVWFGCVVADEILELGRESAIPNKHFMPLLSKRFFPFLCPFIFQSYPLKFNNISFQTTNICKFSILVLCN